MESPSAPPGPARRPLIAATGGCVALVAAAILVLWASGQTTPAAVVSGWRVMVPSTAFVFVCVGLGIAAAGSVPLVRGLVPALAAIGAVLPLLTLFEYVSQSRLGVEHALGIPFPQAHPTAGRMSPVTALTTTLLTGALACLAWRATLADSLVRLAAGTTLTVAWLAVLTVSFDTTRLADMPTFPGMAVPTLVLLSVSSAAILASSAPTMARLQGAHLHAAIAPSTVAGAFLLPLALGQARQTLDGRVDPGLANGLVVLAFAIAVAAVVWRTLGGLQAFQQDRDRLLVDLEARVDDRTLAMEAANRQLFLSEAKLMDADRRKDEFLATLAHELRNPLAPIRTGLSVVKQAAPSSPAAVQSHQVIARQLHHLVRLIDDLLDVSRITANKLELRLERVDLRDVVHQSVETARTDIDATAHDLVVRVPDTPLPVLGDQTRLTQIVANLIQNASKYTPHGGRLEVTAAEEDGVTVRVRDNGIGIAAEHMPVLFETFSQVVPALRRGGGGLGLGLALVRGLVTLHGGVVEVHSGGLGLGSEFVVRLPIAPPAATHEERAATPAAPVVEPVVGQVQRILVVDDNVDNAEALSLYLRTHGHLVATAYDGDEACRQAEHFRPDVVLLDIGLPGRDGHEVCRYLRSQPWGAGILVVAQTGWGQRADRERSRLAGFDAHLVKPVDPAELLALAATPRWQASCSEDERPSGVSPPEAAV